MRCQFAILIVYFLIYCNESAFGDAITTTGEVIPTLKPEEARYVGSVSARAYYDLDHEVDSDIVGIPIEAGLNVNIKAKADATYDIILDDDNYFGGIFNGTYTANYSSNAFIRTDGHKLSLFASGKVSGGGMIDAYNGNGFLVPVVGSRIYLQVFNQATLTYVGSGEVPNIVNSGLNLTYSVFGEAHAAYGGQSPGSPNIAEASAVGRIQIGGETLIFSAAENGSGVFSSQVALSAFAQETLQVGSEGNGFYRSRSYGIQVTMEGHATWGFFEADASKTIELTSATFIDGSTPESHGFEVNFVNGLGSPNIVVPEPSGAYLITGFGIYMTLFGVRGTSLNNKQLI